jgi:hypothetical protein
MKILIVASSLIAFSAFAMGTDLGSMKKDATDSIGREISSLQSSRSCVNGAKTVEAFKACNYSSDMDMQKEEAGMHEGMHEGMHKDMDKGMDDMKKKTIQKKEEVIEKDKDLEKTY